VCVCVCVCMCVCVCVCVCACMYVCVYMSINEKGLLCFSWCVRLSRHHLCPLSAPLFVLFSYYICALPSHCGAFPAVCVCVLCVCVCVCLCICVYVKER